MQGSKEVFDDMYSEIREMKKGARRIGLIHDILIALALVVLAIAMAYYIMGTLYREAVKANEVESAKASAIDRSNKTLYNLQMRYGSIPQERWAGDDRAQWICAKVEIQEMGKIPYGNIPTPFRR